MKQIKILSVIVITLCAVNMVIQGFFFSNFGGVVGWMLAGFFQYSSTMWFQKLQKSRQEHIEFLEKLIKRNER